MAILRNRSTGAVLADSIAFAIPPLRHVVGLLFGNGEPAENIWFERCRGVHTLGLHDDVDVVFLDAYGRVLACCPGVPPDCPSVVYSDARATLKLSPGSLARTDVLIGDVLTLDEV
ncbi:MAG TPA: hypothetical protein VFE70_04445 [Candidatus Elarobacter sp.]|nr:hypothetical protein [Candidatus Elarobacter sp.]